MRRWGVQLVVLGLACVAAPGRAQTATPLAPVDVALPASDEPTASSPTVREPGSAVTTIDLTQRRGEVKDAADHLASVPGVSLQDAGGAGQRKTLSLRGSSSNAVLVLLDGVPLTAPGQSMDLSRIPAAALDRIEVLRGVGSRYGPGGMGGVVNLISRTPDGERAFGELSYGSFDTSQFVVGGAAKVGEGDVLVLGHGLRSAGNFPFRYDATPGFEGGASTLARVNNQALVTGALGRYRVSLGATTLDVLTEGGVEERGLAGTVQNPSVDASQRTARGVLSARSTTTFSQGGQLSVLGFGRVDDSLIQATAFGEGRYAQRESSAGVEATYTQLVAGRHGLTALLTGGGDWLHEPSGRDPSWARGGAMLGDEVLFFDGRLSVDATVRVDVAGPFVVFSPKGSASLQLPRGFELKASFGQASRAPSFIEVYVVQGTLMPNPTLRPERSLGGDASVSWSNAKFAVGVTGFGSLTQDLISYEYYPPALAKPFNFSAASIAGVELEARARPTTWLEASTSYTWLSTMNLRDDPRYYLKALPFRPAHRVSARVVAGVPLAQFRAELLAQSAQFTNRTQTLSLPARAFLNLAVTSTPLKNPALTVGLEVKNVLDVQTQDVDGYPLPPRAVFLTLALAWDGATP